MPNWSEGSMRLRGKKADIKRFIKRLEKSDNDDWFYIPGTRRAFVIGEPYSIDEIVEVFLAEDEPDPTTVALHVCQAWGIDVKSFIEISENYHLDIRIDTVERGMMFTEHYEIIDGEVTENSGESYETVQDFEWNVPYSFLGG